MSDCRSCFWSAELTRESAAVWCSHKVWNGWHRPAQAACNGKAWKKDDR